MKHPHYDTVHTIYHILLYSFIWVFVFVLFVALVVMIPGAVKIASVIWGGFTGIDASEITRYTTEMILYAKFLGMFILLPFVLGCYGWMKKFGKISV